MKILIADDSKQTVDILSALLKKRGHEIDVVYDGKAALDKIKGNDYDLAFLDLNMPELTGLEVAKYVKEHNIKVKTVLLTGYSDMEEFFAKAVGVDEYISKDNTLEGIKKIIDKYSKDEGDS